MNKHPSYEFIVAFAEGKDVQYSLPSGKWIDVQSLRDMDYDYKFRIKPSTKTINGFAVPTPMNKEPARNSMYYYPSVAHLSFFDEKNYVTGWDKSNFERGLCFANKEDAIATAKAMLGIDPTT
jgi:hypothetical protein